MGGIFTICGAETLKPSSSRRTGASSNTSCQQCLNQAQLESHLKIVPHTQPQHSFLSLCKAHARGQYSVCRAVHQSDHPSARSCSIPGCRAVERRHAAVGASHARLWSCLHKSVNLAISIHFAIKLRMSVRILSHQRRMPPKYAVLALSNLYLLMTPLCLRDVTSWSFVVGGSPPRSHRARARRRRARGYSCSAGPLVIDLWMH